jgi:hypothetical protein
LNLRPLGYEPSELPNCSTPRRCAYFMNSRQARQIGSRPGVAPGAARGDRRPAHPSSRRQKRIASPASDLPQSARARELLRRTDHGDLRGEEARTVRPAAIDPVVSFLAELAGAGAGAGAEGRGRVGAQPGTALELGIGTVPLRAASELGLMARLKPACTSQRNFSCRSGDGPFNRSSTRSGRHRRASR